MLDFFIYSAIGVAFILGAFAASFFFAPHKPTEQKLSTYECGEEAIGGSWIQYNVRYYLFGLAFVIFDVEIIFLVPWALTLRSLGRFAFMEMAVFLFILLIGLAYAWRKGALEWP